MPQFQSISKANDRLNDFADVTIDRDEDEQLEAWVTFYRWLGVDGETLEFVSELASGWSRRYGLPENVTFGMVSFGLDLGLMAVRVEEEEKLLREAA
jgi:hypothetical protein